MKSVFLQHPYKFPNVCRNTYVPQLLLTKLMFPDLIPLSDIVTPVHVHTIPFN